MWQGHGNGGKLTFLQMGAIEASSITPIWPRSVLKFAPIEASAIGSLRRGFASSLKHNHSSSLTHLRSKHNQPLIVAMTSPDTTTGNQIEMVACR